MLRVFLCSILLATNGFGVNSEESKLSEFFERAFEEQLSLSPQEKTSIGRKDDNDKLDDLSVDAMTAQHAMRQRHLKTLMSFDRSNLSEAAKQSYDLFKYIQELRIEGYKFRFHDYLLEHKNGVHTNFPVFMANKHEVKSKKDAEAYIARLSAYHNQIHQVMGVLMEQEKRGIMPPRFVYEAVIKSIDELVVGKPMSNVKTDHPLWKDFKGKVDALSLKKEEKRKLLAEAKQVLVTQVKHGYKHLQTFLKSLLKKTDNNDGAWKHPDGQAYYAYMLKYHTSLALSADDVHKIGLSEVARIHSEMKDIQRKLGVKGNLKDFFNHVRNRKGAVCPQNDKGRELCLNINRDFVAAIKRRMTDFLSLKLKDDMIVRRVEEYREKTAGIAFYEGPSEDHKRPGVYYINLHDTDAVPIFEMEALAFHEGIPGHHLQVSLAQSMDVPSFRKFYWQTAFGEGWALYAEYFPKELGFYADPYSDFGRLSAELWRACRLVVDTGLHSKRWTKAKAVQYLIDNTPAGNFESETSIERYIVWPGQATAYKMGMMKILELRENAKKELGKKFSLAKFHDQVLNGGSLPLSFLEKKIQSWVKKQKTAKRS